MKNANIFVDVDLTLVDHNQELIPGVAEALAKLKAHGCHLFLWSTAGTKHAHAMAARYDLDELFEGYCAKPDIIIDDMPSTVLDPFVFNPNDYESADALAEKILTTHID